MAGMVRFFLRQQFPALLWAAIIFLLSSIPANRLPNMKILSFDKLAHIGVFFILGILVYRGLRRPSDSEKFSQGRMIVAFAIVLLYGILDEMHQGLVPGRSVDVLDAVADATGGLLAGVSLYLSSRFRMRKSSKGAG